MAGGTVRKDLAGESSGEQHHLGAAASSGNSSCSSGRRTVSASDSSASSGGNSSSATTAAGDEAKLPMGAQRSAPSAPLQQGGALAGDNDWEDLLPDLLHRACNERWEDLLSSPTGDQGHPIATGDAVEFGNDKFWRPAHTREVLMSARDMAARQGRRKPRKEDFARALAAQQRARTDNVAVARELIEIAQRRGETWDVFKSYVPPHFVTDITLSRLWASVEAARGASSPSSAPQLFAA